MRLDAFLAQREKISRTKCRELILEGKVKVEGRTALKPSLPLEGGEKVELEPGEAFVSRGALKLKAALEEFAPLGLEVSGRLCIDIGASTGGFTQVLLARGARAVIALDVGWGQLSPLLERDPRVRNMEGVNVRSLDPSSLPFPPSFASADLSFISLSLAFPKIAEIGSVRDCVALVKPEFEVGRRGLGKGGVVKDEGKRLECLAAAEEAAQRSGFRIASRIASPIRGEKGNEEFLIWAYR
ncbi:MAG: TlyA family RNA methyltransferase [Aeriscardovia sp.]|nr:TlyA family RNA methyltransferase [Aeriscardovia sp.]